LFLAIYFLGRARRRISKTRRLAVTDKRGTNYDITVVAFLDRKIRDQPGIRDLDQELSRLVEQEKCGKIVLDFSQVAIISSAALGKLIVLDKKVKAHGGKLILCHMRPEIYQVFAITRLNKLFDIKPDENAAMDAF
jgi:anti-sigma B factor antagonist